MTTPIVLLVGEKQKQFKMSQILISHFEIIIVVLKL